MRRTFPHRLWIAVGVCTLLIALALWTGTPHAAPRRAESSGDIGGRPGERSAPLLTADGIGSLRFGTAKHGAITALSAMLGRPSGSGINSGCGPRFTEVDWGQLAVEFRNDSFSGYRYLNRPPDSDALTADPRILRVAGRRLMTTMGITLGDTLGALQRASLRLSAIGADRWRAPDGLEFVDNSPRLPAPATARIIEVRDRVCGQY